MNQPSLHLYVHPNVKGQWGLNQNLSLAPFITIFRFYSYTFFLFFQLSTNAHGNYWPAVEPHKVHKDLKILSRTMADEDELVPVLITSAHFAKELTKSQRFYLLRNLALEVPVQSIRYGFTTCSIFTVKVLPKILFIFCEAITFLTRK